MTRKNRLSWIKNNNPTQIKWAHQYLRKYGVQIAVGSIGLYEDLQDWDDKNPDDSAYRELIRKMKAAWAQKKLRDKHDGRKTHNFILSTKAKGNLDSLAKRQHRSITNTLENLIAQGLDLQKTHDEQLKAFKRQLTEELQAETNSNLTAAITYGELFMSTLAELCSCTLKLTEAEKPGIESSEAASTEKEKLFEKKRKEALESLPTDKRACTKRINKYLVETVLQHENISAPPDAQETPIIEDARESPSN